LPPGRAAKINPSKSDGLVGNISAVKDDQAKKMGWKIPPTSALPGKAGL
jgi:hypothetical protein